MSLPVNHAECDGGLVVNRLQLHNALVQGRDVAIDAPVAPQFALLIEQRNAAGFEHHNSPVGAAVTVN